MQNLNFYLVVFTLLSLIQSADSTAQTVSTIPLGQGRLINFTERINGNIYAFGDDIFESSTRILWKFDGCQLYGLYLDGYQYLDLAKEHLDNQGNLYTRYFDENSNQMLVKYDGLELIPIPNPTGFDNFGLHNLFAIDATDNLFIAYASNATGDDTAFKYDGNTLTEIPNPPNRKVYDTATSNGLFMAFTDGNNNTYIRYREGQFGSYLYKVDGTNLIEIVAPNASFFGDFVGLDVNGHPFLAFGASTYLYDGNNFTTISDDVDGYTLDDLKATDSNGNYYIEDDVSSFNSDKKLLKYNASTGLTEITGPSGGIARFFYMDAAENVYGYYENPSEEFVYFKYDGNNLTTIPNPSGKTAGGFVLEHNGLIYLSYFGAGFSSFLYKYDGNSTTEIVLPGQNFAFIKFNPLNNHLLIAGNAGTSQRDFYQYDGNVLIPIDSPNGFPWVEQLYELGGKVFIAYKDEAFGNQQRLYELLNTMPQPTLQAIAENPDVNFRDGLLWYSDNYVFGNMDDAGDYFIGKFVPNDCDNACGGNIDLGSATYRYGRFRAGGQLTMGGTIKKDVVAVGGESVLLSEGFETEDGATFSADVDGDLAEQSNCIPLFSSPIIENNTFQQEQMLSSSFEIFPNPTIGIVNLQPLAGFHEIHLFNAVGQSMLRLPVTSNFMEIDVSEYPKGIYFVQILKKGEDKNNRQIEKSIVKKLVIK